MKNSVKLCIIFILVTLPLFGIEFIKKDGIYRGTFENVVISDDENMGLFGLGYFLNLDENYYFGPSFYGAMTGKRGGFFVGGFEGGYTYKMNDHISLEAGLFMGGGGGGSAPQGGGLMLRPHLSLMYDFSPMKIGIGLSEVKFPNGDIDSKQIFLQTEIPFDTVYLKGHKFGLNTTYNAVKDQISKNFHSTYTAATFEHYSPTNDSLNTNSTIKTKDFQLLGFEYGSFLNENMFLFMQTAGAMGGQMGGYMEVFSGLGYKYNIDGTALSTDIRMELGAGGGGRVDTGGGLATKLKSGLSYNFSNNFSLRADIGYMHSMDGTFNASTYGLNILYHLNAPSANTLHNQNKDIFLFTSPWSMSLTHKTYLPSDSMLLDKSREVKQIDLIGLKIRKHIHPNFYLTGEAYGAYKGETGGYAEGLLGVGWESSKFLNNFKLRAEFLLGAGAGGGVDSNSGAITEATVGGSYVLSKSWDIGLNIGKMRSIKPGINTTTLNLDLTYKFSTLDF